MGVGAGLVENVAVEVDEGGGGEVEVGEKAVHVLGYYAGNVVVGLEGFYY